MDAQPLQQQQAPQTPPERQRERQSEKGNRKITNHETVPNGSTALATAASPTDPNRERQTDREVQKTELIISYHEQQAPQTPPE